jgi:hypothetical protein
MPLRFPQRAQGLHDTEYPLVPIGPIAKRQANLALVKLASELGHSPAARVRASPQRQTRARLNTKYVMSFRNPMPRGVSAPTCINPAFITSEMTVIASDDFPCEFRNRGF